LEVGHNNILKIKKVQNKIAVNLNRNLGNIDSKCSFISFVKKLLCKCISTIPVCFHRL